MLCLDTFIPSGALYNIPHTINKTMDIPVTLLRKPPEMIVRQHDSGKKRTVKRLCVTNVTGLHKKVCLKESEFWRKVVSNIMLLHEKFLQFDWLRAVVFQLNLKYLHVIYTTERDHLLLHT